MLLSKGGLARIASKHEVQGEKNGGVRGWAQVEQRSMPGCQATFIPVVGIPYQAENGIAELLRLELVFRVMAIADPVLRSWTQKLVEAGAVPLMGCEDEKETKRSSIENSG